MLFFDLVSKPPPALFDAFEILHSVFWILYSAFCNQNSAFCTLHSAFCNWNWLSMVSIKFLGETRNKDIDNATYKKRVFCCWCGLCPRLTKLEGAFSKVSIPYRKFFTNEPLQANFKRRGPGRAPGCLQASPRSSLLEVGLQWLICKEFSVRNWDFWKGSF